MHDAPSSLSLPPALLSLSLESPLESPLSSLLALSPLDVAMLATDGLWDVLSRSFSLLRRLE